MVFRRHTLLICHKSEAPTGFTPKRLVFSGHGPSVPPSREELIEQEVREGVNLERTQIEGYYLTNPPNPTIEMGRLGVRTEIAATLRTQNAPGGGLMTDADIQEGIINERINSQLRTLAAHHVAEHHQQMGWVGKKLHSVRETVSDVSNPFRAVGRFFRSFRGGNPNDLRYNTAEERHLEHEMRQLFGRDRNPDRIADHIIDSIDDAHLDSAVPILRVGALAPPATARADLETWLRTSNVAALEAHLQLARRAPPEFLHSYELLLNVRRVHARERSKILSIELYNPTRLRGFLEDMKTHSAADHKLLTEQILEKSSLDNLDSDPASQALLAHLMYLYEGTPPANWTTVHTHLDEIWKALPEVKTGGTVAEAEKPENVKTAEKIDEHYKALKDNATKMHSGYRKAAPTARLITTLNAQLATLTAAGGPSMDAKARASMVQETQKKILELEVKRTEILHEVNEAEQGYKDSANDLVNFLMKSQNQTALPAGVPNLTTLQGVNVMGVSSETELFKLVPVGGGAPRASALELHSAALTTSFFNTLNTEIDTNYKKIIKGREKISARQLLVSLKERRLQDNGVLDEGRRLKMAIFSANLMIADVKSVDLYRAGNREIAETMITGWRGWRRRASQSIASKFFNSNTFTARDIVDHVAEVDPEKKFEFLKGLNPESSLADLRHLIHEHHVHIDDLSGARAHLQKVLEGLTVGHHDRVEIADTSWTIENLVHNLLMLETEMESRAFFDAVQNPVNPEDKKLPKAQYLKKLWGQTYDSDQKRQEGIAAKLQNFPNTLKKALMKGTWGKQYEEGLKEGKEKGLTGQALKEYLQNEKKIPGAVLKHLMTGLALKEAYDIGKGTVGWVGKKLGKGAKGVAKFGVEKGGNLMSSAWNRLAKPGLFATGRGMKKAGKFALWDVPKFALWTTPKFLVWDAPVWTAKKATKAAVWPFKMAGKALSGFWNIFHYGPEKAAKDKAWYDAKKAKGGGGGGHGGGGHGGGGH